MRLHLVLFGVLALIPLVSSLTMENGVEIVVENVTYDFANSISGLTSIVVGNDWLAIDTDNLSFDPGKKDLNISIVSFTDNVANSFRMIGENTRVNYTIKDGTTNATILMNGLFYPGHFIAPLISTVWSYFPQYDLTIYFRDETTGSLITQPTNLELYDDAYMILHNYTTSNGSLHINDMTMSNYVMKYYATNYDTRFHDFNYLKWDGNDLTLYLVPTNGTDNVTFIFKDSSGLSLEDVRLIISTYVNNTLTIISDTNSNVLGQIIQTYIPNTYYCYNATKDGYDDKNFCLDTITENTYNIIMTDDSGSGNIIGEGRIIIRSLAHLTNNVTAWEQVMFYNHNSDFAFYQLNITYNGSTTSINATSQIGSTINASISTLGSSNGDKVYVTAYYRTIDGHAKTIRWTRTIGSGAGLERFRLENTGLDAKTAAILGTIIIMLVAGVFASAGSMVGSPGVGGALGALLAGGVLAYLNWIPDNAFYILGLVCALYIATRIGGTL